MTGVVAALLLIGACVGLAAGLWWGHRAHAAADDSPNTTIYAYFANGERVVIRGRRTRGGGTIVLRECVVEGGMR